MLSVDSFPSLWDAFFYSEAVRRFNYLPVNKRDSARALSY